MLKSPNLEEYFCCQEAFKTRTMPIVESIIHARHSTTQHPASITVHHRSGWGLAISSFSVYLKYKVEEKDDSFF